MKTQNAPKKRVVRRVIKKRKPAAAASPSSSPAAVATTPPSSPPLEVSAAAPTPSRKKEQKTKVEDDAPLKSILKQYKAPKRVTTVAPKKKVAKREPRPEDLVKSSVFIVAGTYDGSVAGFRFNPVKQNLTPTFAVKPHQGYISSVAQSEKWILSGASDEGINIFNGKRMTDVGTCGSEGTPTIMKIMDEANVLCATSTGMIQIYQTHDWITIWKEQGHRREINDLALHPNSSLAVTVGEDNFLKLWDFNKCKLVLQVKLDFSASHARFLPDGSGYFLVCKQKALLYNMQGEQLAEHKLPEEACSVELVEDAFLFGLEDGSIVCLDVTTGFTQKWAIPAAHPARVRSMSFAHEEGEDFVVSVCSAGNLVVWNCNGNSPLTEAVRLPQGARFTTVSALWR